MYRKFYKIKIDRILAKRLLDDYDKLDDVEITKNKDIKMTLDITFLLNKLIEYRKILKEQDSIKHKDIAKELMSDDDEQETIDDIESMAEDINKKLKDTELLK